MKRIIFIPMKYNYSFGLCLVALSCLMAGALWAQVPSKQIAADDKVKAEAPLERKKIYNAQSMTLDNGMQIVVIENHRTPAVTHMVWYKIGGADEPMGESGLAHYLEHLMFKGTEMVPSGELSKRVKAWGGNDNAFTSWDFTSYFQTIPNDKLEAVMMMESDRMRNLNFDDTDALTERDVIIEERKQRTDSNPSAQLSESMRAAMYINHPYARPIIGWDDELKQLNPKRAREFYHTYYAPKNAVMVISGDVNTQDVFDMAQRIYGPLDNDGAQKRPVWPNVAMTKGAQVITLAHEDVQQPIWRRNYRVPSMGQNYKESLALALLDEIVGGSTGRLYQSLVVEKELVSSASFYYSGTAIADGMVSVVVTPRDDVPASAIEQAIADVLAEVAVNGPTQDELQKAIAKIQDESVYELDSLSGPAMMVGYQLACGLTLDQIEGWIYDLEAVSVADIQSVVGAYLMPDAQRYHAVTGYLVPKVQSVTPKEQE